MSRQFVLTVRVSTFDYTFRTYGVHQRGRSVLSSPVNARPSGRFPRWARRANVFFEWGTCRSFRADREQRALVLDERREIETRVPGARDIGRRGGVGRAARRVTRAIRPRTRGASRVVDVR